MESLTAHANSIKDDVLNTHYFSHYNQQYGKVPERNEHEEAIKHLERMIDQLKCKQAVLASAKGRDADDDAEKARQETYRFALVEYEKLLRAPPNDSKKLIISAYEKILTDKRKLEKEMLNKVRF